MSRQQRGRSYSNTQSTSPYQNTEEQELPAVGRQNSTGSSMYSQPSYNENAQQQTLPTSLRDDPPQEQDEYYHQQPPYYQDSAIADGHTLARNSTQAYFPEQQQPYPYVAQGYNPQYMGYQGDYRASQDNHRGTKDFYRGSYDQNNAYHPRDYNTNVYPNNSFPPQDNPSGDPQFDIYSDFNNAHPRTHEFDEDNDSGAQTPTLRNNDSPGGPESMMDTGTYPSDQLTQGLIDEPKLKSSRSPRCCCCSRKICVIITFIILAALGITAYFVYPRIPSVKILDAQPDGNPTISLAQARLLMNFNLRIEIDNPDNWVPIRFNEIDAQVYDVNTLSTYSRPIATGNVTHYSLPPRTTSILNFPLTVDYIGNNTADPTILDFQSACTPPVNGAQATTLNIRADITLSVWGLSLFYKPHVSVGLSNLVCPYSQLSQYINNLNSTNLSNIFGS